MAWPKLLGLAAILLLSACVSGLGYGEVEHSKLSAGERCNPTEGSIANIDAKPFFAVTSRLPDCRNDSITLTSYRADKLRYARFGLRPPTKAKDKISNVDLAMQTESKWWADMAAAAKANDGKLLLYVHGYRENFSRSARDTTQIGRLANFDGPVIHYSWPSIGELLSYTVDQTSVTWDTRNFRRFVKKLAEQPWAKDITIVSHSLGARLVLPGVRYVDRTSNRKNASNLSHIILASPDSDRDIFERDFGPALLSPKHMATGRRITIFLSNKDKALNISRTVHGYPRLGRPFCFDPFKAAKLVENGHPPRCYPTKLGNEAITESSGVTIIDTTELSVGSGHSNHLRSAAVCKIFAQVLQRRQVTLNATRLPYVFGMQAYGEKEKPAHDDICKRFMPAIESN